MISGRSILRMRMNKLSCAVQEARKLLQSRLSNRKACNSVVSWRRGMYTTIVCFIYHFFLKYLLHMWSSMLVRITRGGVQWVPKMHCNVVAVIVNNGPDTHLYFVCYIFWFVWSWILYYLRDGFNMYLNGERQDQRVCVLVPLAAREYVYQM